MPKAQAWRSSHRRIVLYATSHWPTAKALGDGAWVTLGVWAAGCEVHARLANGGMEARFLRPCESDESACRGRNDPPVRPGRFSTIRAAIAICPPPGFVTRSCYCSRHDRHRIMLAWTRHSQAHAMGGRRRVWVSLATWSHNERTIQAYQQAQYSRLCRRALSQELAMAPLVRTFGLVRQAPSISSKMQRL